MGETGLNDVQFANLLERIQSFGSPASGSGLASTTGAAGAAGSGFGFNLPTANMALSGLGVLGNLWGGFQANSIAKDQLRFTKDVTNTNLNNQIKSYNTSLEDRARSRAAVEGQSTADMQAYLDKNRLSR